MDSCTAELAWARQLVEAALAAGADDAEVMQRYGSSTTITVRPQGILTESQGQQSTLVLRVWCQGQTAAQTIEGALPRDGGVLARTTVAAARRDGVAVPCWVVPGASTVSALPTVSVVDPAERRATLARCLEQTIAEPALAQAIISGYYDNNTLWSLLVNSQGLATAVQVAQQTFWLWAEGPAGRLAEGSFHPTFAGLEVAEQCHRLAERHSFLAQATIAVPSGLTTVVLPPEATAHLAAMLGSLFSADQVQRTAPAVLARLGRPIAAPTVTLIDDSTRPGGLRSRPLDDEGTPTGVTPLIVAGRLEALLHTRQTAAALAAAPNGKATRPTPWSPPRCAPSNIYLQPGTLPPEALRAQLQRGLIVEYVQQMGGIADEGGAFRLTVAGWWVEDGHPPVRVRDVRLSANLFALLREIQACGTDLKFSLMANGAGGPSILIRQMRAEMG